MRRIVTDLAPCPDCNTPNVKPRTGTLGEAKGVWCAQCGFTSTHNPAAWNDLAQAEARVRAAVTKHIGLSLSPVTSIYAHQIEVCSGSNLDYAASRLYGATRAVGETDEAFRQRILGDSQ